MLKQPFRGLAVALFLTLGTLSLAASTPGPDLPDWAVDGSHTEVNFVTRHFFTPVRGSFQDFQVDLDYDAERPENSSVRVTIDVASVDTGNERRDDHLRTADWFNAERWPTMTFQSTSVRQAGDGRLVATGDLTIRDVTREVELPITVLGVQDIPEPMREMLDGAQQVASFQADLTLDRREFGVGTGSWAQTTIVGGDVEIEIALEAAYR